MFLGITLIEANTISGASGLHQQTLFQYFQGSMVPFAPMKVPQQSCFTNKMISPQIQQQLLQILNTFKSRQNMPFQDVYSQIFNQDYLSKSDFERQIQGPCGISLFGMNLDLVFGFFQISVETMLSKIAFVQALKALERRQQGPMMQQPPQMIQQPPQMMPQQPQMMPIQQPQPVIQVQQPNINLPLYKPYSPPNSSNNIEKQAIDSIKIALEKNNIKDIRRQVGLSVHLCAGKYVVVFEEFQAFLRQFIGLDLKVAFQVAEKFLYTPSGQQMGGMNQYLIDIEAFESSIYQSMAQNGQNQYLNYYEQQKPNYQTLQIVTDHVKRYLLMTGGNIQKFFQEADLDQDNFISQQELQVLLQKLGAQITPSETAGIMHVFDTNRDGSVSYSEMCKYFADCSNLKAITDRQHWAFYIFENIRHVCTSTGQSLAQIFGVPTAQFKGWEKKVSIPKDQFMNALRGMRIPIYPEVETKLLNLLHTGEQSNEVDFLFLSELVGQNYQPVELISTEIKYWQSQPIQAISIQEKNRKFFRTLGKAINQSYLTIDALEAVLRNTEIMSNPIAGQNAGLLPMNVFTSKVSQYIGGTLTEAMIQDSCQRFSNQQSQVKYHDFIRSTKFELEKHKLMDTIFQTLQAALRSTTSLRDLFNRVAPVQAYMDGKSLENVLNMACGVQLQKWEIDMIVMEYQESGHPGSFCFDTFEKDFKECSGIQTIQPAYMTDMRKDFDQYLHAAKPVRRLINNPSVKEAIRKIAATFIQNSYLRLSDLITKYKVSPTTGAISSMDLKTMLQNEFRLRYDETDHVNQHYDPTGRGDIRIQELLQDVQELVDQVERRIEIMNVVTQFSVTNPQQQLSELDLLQSYAKDFEEIFKAVVGRGLNSTIELFANYAQSSRQHINKREFSAALLSLGLTRTFSEQDLDAIIQVVGKNSGGTIEIRAINDLIMKFIGSKSMPELQDEILERLARSFNGDDAFLMRELSRNTSPQSPSLIETANFVTVIKTSLPLGVQITSNDILFIARKYIKQVPGIQHSQLIDINTLHTDVKNLMSRKGIAQGFYSVSHNNQMLPNFGAQPISSGHINPMLGMGTRNTRSEQIQPNRAFERQQFRLDTVADNYFEELVKGTYVRGQGDTVYAFFKQHSQSNETLTNLEFRQAIQVLDMGWTINSIENVFSQFDLKINSRITGRLTAMQIDELVCLGCKKTIPEMQDEILKQIAQHALQKDYDFKNMIIQQDIARQQMIKVEAFLDIVLNKMKLPILIQLDVIFLAKKYIVTLPSHLEYVQLIEDFNMICKQGIVGSVANFKNICAYIRKACLGAFNLTEPDQYFRKHCTQYPREPLMTPGEFLKSCQNLGMIPDVCTQEQVGALYTEMDSANTRKLTMDQINSYIKKISVKSTRELQEEVIDEIAVKVNKGNVQLDMIFRQQDPKDRALIGQSLFIEILQRNFQTKIIDAKVLSMRYIESQEEVNYKKFMQDVQQKVSSVGLHERLDNAGGAGPNLMQPGIHKIDTNSEASKRLRILLQQVNDYATKTRVQLSNLFANYEIQGGFATYDSFVTILRQQIPPITPNDIDFLAENYLVFSNSSSSQRSIDYRKFLSDLKLYTPTKQLTSLTREQAKFYTDLQANMVRQQNMTRFAQALVEADSSMRGYMSQAQIEGAFRASGQQMSQMMIATAVSALQMNQQGEYCWKEMLELIMGGEKAQEFFTGAAISGGGRPNTGAQKNVPQFLMPIQPQNHNSPILGEIGKLFIKSGKNYEAEFAQRMGPQQTTQVSPKVAESDITGVLNSCGIKFSNDERIAFSSLLSSLKDQYGQYPILDLLRAIGLPAQTLGPIAISLAPKKILSQAELKQAQQLIISLRKELDKFKKRPQDMFERCKQKPSDLSIPEFQFRQVLTQNPEFGQVGRLLNDNQLRILMMYLTQEVPNEVSYKKLYLAFTQVETDQPLAQEGSEAIRNYEQKIRDQASRGANPHVFELIQFMRSNQLTIHQMFKGQSGARGRIPRQEFETQIANAGFKSSDIYKLIEALDDGGKRIHVNLDKLQDALQKMVNIQKPGAMTAAVARDRYAHFEPQVRSILQRISEHLKRNGITLQALYNIMDQNKDGKIDRDEFVLTLPSILNVPSIDMREYVYVFNALDINNDGSLSVNEFALFLEGAKMDKLQRVKEIDPQLIIEMQNEALNLFRQFDQNGDGFVTAEEIQRAMLTLGQTIDITQAQTMVKQADSNGDGRLDQKEFQEIMLNKMKDELLSQDQNVEDLRLLFMDADVDHSGILTIDEINGVLMSMGAKLEIDDLIELMNEIDVDRDGTVDIDEFVALMTSTGEELQFKSEHSKRTLQTIKKSRKLNPLDFFKCFKNMPQSFVPSFINERWQQHKNLPSSVFMPMLDPSTMLYKDLKPVLQENISSNLPAQKDFYPRIRPAPTEIGCEIFFTEATGVPLPTGGAQFDRSNIVKRAVRIGIFDTFKKEYVANTSQVNAAYEGELAEDVWKFAPERDNGLNPTIFRCSKKDEVCKQNFFMIFELVIYVRSGEKVTEVSCGWCQLELENPEVFSRQFTHKLPIKGGSPSAELIIKDSDIHKNRTGIKYSLMNLVTSKIESQLVLEIRPYSKFTDENKFHTDMLPQTCFISKKLLFFVSGFRNYLGTQLLSNGTSLITFKKPQGDPLVPTFAKALDNPDICEHLVTVWSDDVVSQLTAKQKMNVSEIIRRTTEYLRRLYPVAYADGFQMRESTVTQSACGEQQLLRVREDLIKSALCHGNAQAKVRADRALETLTTFKPFTVREFEYNVWDTPHTNKCEMYMSQYGEAGLLRNSPRGQAVPQNNLRNDQFFNSNVAAQQQQLGQNLGHASFGQQSFQQQNAPIPTFSLNDAFNKRF